MKKITVIGHFGGDKNFCDGQTVKTRELHKQLVIQFGNEQVGVIDTYRGKIKAILKAFNALRTSENVVMLFGANGAKFFIPIIVAYNKLLKRYLIHDIIGAKCHELVGSSNRLIKSFKKLDCQFSESNYMIEQFIKLGIDNGVYLPNFKELTPVSADSVYENKDNLDVKKFCMFSRMTPEKGIKNAIMSIDKLNNEQGKIIAKLDLFGPIAPEYKDEFDKLIEDYSDCATYNGVIDPSQSVDTLKD